MDELASMTRLSVANASKHLQELRRAGLVRARKEGLRVFYELAGPDVVDLIAALGLVAETRLAEMAQLVRTYITARDDLEPIAAAELTLMIRPQPAAVMSPMKARQVRYGPTSFTENVSIPFSGV